MSSSRMVDAVNRLIGDMLSGAGEVFLPGVGSLYTEQQGAQRTDKQTILPPCRVVSFSSQERGESLVGGIAVAAGVDQTKAEEIYQTWLARTRTENGILIEGIGELKFKNFLLTSEFDKRLNPAGHASVKISSKRSFDWVLWMGLVAIVVAGVVLGYQLLWSPSLNIEPQLAQSELVERAQTTTSADSPALTNDALVSGDASETATQTTAEAVPETTPVVEAPAQPAKAATSTQAAPSVQPQTPTSAADVLATVPGRYYVVLGVFSTLENAKRAIEEALTKNPQWKCGIYRMGAKFMVTPFEGTSEACGQFVAENKSANPGMWPYKAR